MLTRYTSLGLEVLDEGLTEETLCVTDCIISNIHSTFVNEGHALGCQLSDLCKLEAGNIKGKEEYLYSAIYTMHSLKALRHRSHSFTCKLHHACLSPVSVHQMAPPVTEVADMQMQLTTQLSTPKG